MKRDLTPFLINWLSKSDRKPLVIRGARQVGKTWLIRDLASSGQKELVELNFEKRRDLQSLFVSNEPVEILQNISAFIGRKIEPSQTILFLDEIQVAPHLLAKLRWFYEDMRELAVVAAGSLLDFALSEHEFSMPVGRMSYVYLEPFSFEEFLSAMDKEELRTYLKNYRLGIDIPEALHNQLMKLVKEYMIIGGMPAALLSWKQEGLPQSINQVHFDLLATYRDDFAKYKGRLLIDRLEDVMASVPRQLGEKFTYSEVNREVSALPLKQALELLCKARICRRVSSTSANGLPLGAEINDKFSKVIFFDTGLVAASLGLSLHELHSLSEIGVINKGGMAEQLVGQILSTVAPPYLDPSLYYWQRTKKGSQAEVDYVIQHENQIIPIEVKAGTTGSLKSLREFIIEKRSSQAIRINSDKPSVYQGEIKDGLGETIRYRLLSLPFYLLGQVHRLINN